MNIQDIIKSGANVTIAVNATDLLEFAQTIVDQAKSELEASIAESRSEVYYTPEQVMSMMNVCRRTLFRWQKEGNKNYLVPVRVGGLTRYRKSDVDKILEK